MKTQVKILGTIVIFGLLFSFMSCKKAEQNGTMSVGMTDAPTNLVKVNVEVIGLEVHHESAGWINLPINQGIYNLLDLQNDVSVVLANNVQIPIGQINQLRMILGSNNSVVDSIGSYPITIPSGSESGLKININQTITSNQHVQIVLDFDAFSSVIFEGSSKYYLKPVIKIKSIVQS